VTATPAERLRAGRRRGAGDRRLDAVRHGRDGTAPVCRGDAACWTVGDGSSEGQNTGATTEQTRNTSVTRHGVLERLPARSDAARQGRTTVATLASALGADEAAVGDHLSALATCELARLDADGSTRVTVTGEELLALDADELAVVDAAAPDAEDRGL
jgi:hypothetical protein